MKRDTADALFKVHAIGEIPAPFASLVLLRISRCYTTLKIFQELRPRTGGGVEGFFRRYAQDLTTADPVAVTWLKPQALQLKSVVLQSPGFWEFFGKWNPLEALRLYLNDRHERRKDFAYRNQADAERLALENKQKQLTLVAEVLALARASGVPESEITTVFRELVLIPFLQLDTLQDKGLITYAEISTPRSVELPEDEPVDA